MWMVDAVGGAHALAREAWLVKRLATRTAKGNEGVDWVGMS